MSSRTFGSLGFSTVVAVEAASCDFVNNTIKIKYRLRLNLIICVNCDKEHMMIIKCDISESNKR